MATFTLNINSITAIEPLIGSEVVTSFTCYTSSAMDINAEIGDTIQLTFSINVLPNIYNIQLNTGFGYFTISTTGTYTFIHTGATSLNIDLGNTVLTEVIVLNITGVNTSSGETDLKIIYKNSTGSPC